MAERLGHMPIIGGTLMIVDLISRRNAIAATFALSFSRLQASEPSFQRLDDSSLPFSRVDDTVARLMKEGEVTGLALALFDRGTPVYVKAYGLRDAEKKLPLTTDSVISAASLTKSTFACLVMQLVEGGKLDLDKPVHEYLPKPLPEYKEYADLAGDERYKKITARMILSYTTGFPNWRWISEDRKLRIHFEPGSRYAYSGEGIQLLQLVVETITGKPIAELMLERIFKPFGMTRTSMVYEPRFADDLASGHDEWGRSIGARRPKRAGAAGSMLTTVTDFARLLQSVYMHKGMRKETTDLMLSPQVRIKQKKQFPSLNTEVTDKNDPIRLSYGLGWGLYWTPFGKAFFKEGHDEGFQNYGVMFEKSGRGLLMLSNSDNAEGIFAELIETLLANPHTPIEWEGYTKHQDRPKREPLRVHKEVALTPAQLERVTGRYRITADAVLTITREEGHLLVTEPGQSPERLYPEAELSFFSKSSGDEVTFELNAQGTVDQLTVHTRGGKIPLKRIR
jgi:CubicO group peptidase (beta-lactamase class C family)